MKRAIKALLILPALSISVSQLFSNYYGQTEKTNTIEIFRKGAQLTANDNRQTEKTNIQFYTQNESISSICRKD